MSPWTVAAHPLPPPPPPQGHWNYLKVWERCGLVSSAEVERLAREEGGRIEVLGLQGRLSADFPGSLGRLLLASSSLGFFFFPLRNFDKQSYSLFLVNIEACHVLCLNQSSSLTVPILLGRDPTRARTGGGAEEGCWGGGPGRFPGGQSQRQGSSGVWRCLLGGALSKRSPVRAP